MARLRKAHCSESEDGDSAYGASRGLTKPRMNRSLSGRQSRKSPQKQLTGTDGNPSFQPNDEGDAKDLCIVPKIPRGDSKRSKQIRLTPLKCLYGTDKSHNLMSMRKLVFQPLEPTEEESPKRRSRAHVQTVATESAYVAKEIGGNPGALETEIVESVWCGSDDPDLGTSDDDLPSPRTFLPARKANTGEIDVCSQLVNSLGDLQILDDANGMPAHPHRSLTVGQVSVSRPSSSSDKENNNALLRFSPPHLYGPTKQRPAPRARDMTPPPSPSKGRLQSPSKQRVRVPTPPHRPSIGAFWDSETVNDWNDQHSPRKDWKSPVKFDTVQDDASASPTSSPRKGSPAKRTKAEIQAKKDWEARKHSLAETFLVELDQAIASGQISTLANQTGGIKIIWSKTLKQTAGRANWRNEKTRVQHLDGSITVINKHHAAVELAEKVIDDETRLLNVLAHEFCHLCNFMISGIKDQPHGKQFKEWGRKASFAFASRGIEVTTKHTYTIEYKYLWRCSGESCGAEFKRHSKSIDPLKQRCGSCKGTLVQIKPVPRKETAGGTAKVNSYAAFVKAHYAIVKKEMLNSSQKEVMEAVAKKYRAEKAMAVDEKQRLGIDGSSVPEMEYVARRLEFVDLNDG
nr:hmg box-containing protein c19g7.04 [Quercus suber]